MRAEPDPQPFSTPDIAQPVGDSDDDETRAARLANLFDIRRVIGGVYLVYGVLLALLGVFGAKHIKVQASGININLWTGIGMIVVAVLMIAWALARPVSPRRSSAT